MADFTPMTDEQRKQWRETRLFPVERWGMDSDDATPLVCPMPDRALLRKLAEGVPAHIRGSGWYATAQRYEQRTVYADDFSGMGRQAIASICSDKGRYFGTLTDFMAAACPRTVLRLLDRIEELERAAGVPDTHQNSCSNSSSTSGVMGDCGSADCNWRGPISECSYLGAVGPCCPKCREIVEPDTPGVSASAHQGGSQQTPLHHHKGEG